MSRRCFRLLAGVLLLLSALAAPARDVTAEVGALARRLAPHTGRVVWEAPLESEAADLLEEIGGGRLLVGTVATGSKLGVPRHGPLVLHDLRTGRELWRAKRASRPEGQYSLLATRPLLVLLGVERGRGELTGIDPRTGRTRWKHPVGFPARLRAHGDRLVVLSSREGSLQLLDLARGRPAWKTSIRKDFGKGADPRLEITGDLAILCTDRWKAYSLESGKAVWSVGSPSAGGEKAVVVAGSGVVLWGGGRTLRVDPEDGRILWKQEGDRAAHAVHVLGERVVRVTTTGTRTVLEALRLEDGRRLWRHEYDQPLVSPVVEAGGIWLVSGEAHVLGLRPSDGKRLFTTALPPSFVAGSPRRAPLVGLPDLLLAREGKVILHRERSGVAALALPGGKLLWSQGPYGPNVEYTVNDATLLSRVSRGLPHQVTPGNSMVPWDRPGPNRFMIAAEKQHAEVMARTSRVLGSSSASRGDRRSAIATREMSSRLSAANQQVAMAGEQMMAGAAMASSIMSFGAALKEMRRKRAQQGLRQRYDMLALATMRNRSRAFQGRFFLDPFLAKGSGHGVTLVDLESGERADVLYSPLVLPLIQYSVDLIAFHVDEAGERLVTVGVGFDPTRFRVRKKWRQRFPGRSLLAYDLSKLPFRKESALRRTLAPAAPPVPVFVPPVGPAPAAAGAAPVGGAVARLHAAIRENRLDGFREALAAGADVNGRTAPTGETPLTQALREKREGMITTLLEKGADVTLAGAYGLTPLHYASRDLRVALVRRCLAAGAPVDAVNTQGTTPLMMLLNPYQSFQGEAMLEVVRMLVAHGADTGRKHPLAGGKTLKQVARGIDRRLGAVVK